MGCYVVRMLRNAPPSPGPGKGSQRRGFGRIRKERSGRYSAAYVGPDQELHRASVTFETKDDAVSWITAERRLIAADDWTPPTERLAAKVDRGQALKPYADEWLRKAANRPVRPLKPRTQEHYRWLLDEHILPTLGDVRMKALTGPVVDAWFSDLDGRKPTTRAHAYALLATILREAVAGGIIAKSPCQHPEWARAGRAHEIDLLSVDDLDALADAMPDGRRLMVLLAAWTGLRYGELIELRRQDVKLGTGGRLDTVKVRRGAVRLEGGRRFEVGDPKSGAGKRDVKVPPHLHGELAAHLRGLPRSPGALLFPGSQGQHLQVSTFYGKAPRRTVDPQTGDESLTGGSGFYKARAVAGYPQLHFHDLRHFAGTMAARTGATTAELMARMGHSSTKAAQIYQHAAADREERIAAELSRMARGDGQ